MSVYNSRAADRVSADGDYLAERIARTGATDGCVSATAAHPRNALVELTNGCNHACIFCKNSNQGRRATFLPLARFERFVDEAVPLGLEELGLYATGEPFMTKNLVDYVRTAKRAGVGRVYLTSNGALASLERVVECHEAGLDSIKFSINASNREDYELVHGFDDFDKVVRNVRDVAAWRRASDVPLQLLCSCVIIPSVGDIRAEHRALFEGVFDDVIYVEAGSQGGQAFELIDELAVSPHGVFGNLGKTVAVADLKPCAMVWNRYHLTAEGYLTACCVDYELDLVFADLAKESLSEGWNNTSVQGLRQAHLDGDLEGLLCNQCLRNEKLPYAPLGSVTKSIKSERIREQERGYLKDRLVVSLKLVD